MTSRSYNASSAARFHRLVGAAAGLLLAAAPAAAWHRTSHGSAQAQPLPPAVAPAPVAGNDDDDAFHEMFLSWNKQDSVHQPATISVPSVRPINMGTFTSGYGVRSDPFHGTAAMHAGIDLAAPTGSAVYATADGVIDRAEWFGGYGNCVEIDHGKGVQTRFGHLSRILVRDGQHVHRGDLIALVGSTGRSTGPHLHYEVRIDGHAVNPIPFLQASDYVVAMQQRSTIAIGGPEDDAD